MAEVQVGATVTCVGLPGPDETREARVLDIKPDGRLLVVPLGPGDASRVKLDPANIVETDDPDDDEEDE